MRIIQRVSWLIGVAFVLGAAAQDSAHKVAVGEFGQDTSRQFGTADGLPKEFDAVWVRLRPENLVLRAHEFNASFRNGKCSVMEGDIYPFLDNLKRGATIHLKDGDVRINYNVTRNLDGFTATDRGLYYGKNSERPPRTEPTKIVRADGMGRTWGDSEVLAACIAPDESWWICTKAGILHDSKTGPKVYEPQSGLPTTAFTCMDVSPDGTAWFGTSKGVIRLHGDQFAYRNGKRWLPNDSVTDILAMPDGSALVATKGGVAHLTTEPMTFAKKAAHYEEQVEKYIKRTEYGYVAESFTEKPGDLTTIRHTDSDNDGLWTAMYGAGECFAYAATKDPKAKQRAKQAFEALRFLQKVTQGGEHSPPKGFVARSILPTDGRDPNIGRLQGDIEDQKNHDKLWKVYEPRWPKSADGKWYWKSDTSSDELDGHYFFYAAYYDLAAETEEEKERVREVVRDLTNHLVDHGFRLIDHDGKVTRWGDFSPESLNGDRRWYVERGINSLSMLSYLAVAEHITGDQKFADATMLLIEKHHYDQNAMMPKIQYGVGSGNQSDDEMEFMSFYDLIKYTKSDDLRERMRHVFFNYWKLEYPEMNPFFNFACAAMCSGTTSNTHWGAVDLTPYEGWLEDSVATLKGFPLDRFNWGIQNSHRLDLVPLGRHQTIDLDDRKPPRRGYRVNGKVLPVEERFFNHWNTDPFELDYPGNGQMLASGTVFLLPYYMGLYHGFIE